MGQWLLLNAKQSFNENLNLLVRIKFLNLFLYSSKWKLKHLLCRTKFYWSLERGPLLIVKTGQVSNFSATRIMVRKSCISMRWWCLLFFNSASSLKQVQGVTLTQTPYPVSKPTSLKNGNQLFTNNWQYFHTEEPNTLKVNFCQFLRCLH